MKYTAVAFVLAVRLVFAIGLLLILRTPVQALPMDVDLEKYAEAPTLNLSSSRLQQVSEFTFLFVGGYGNELARDHYFQLNVQTVREMGANAETFFPSSLNSAAGNIEALRLAVLKTYRDGGNKPVVLIGHSKGGLESLATVLQHPELVREGVVANVVTVQSPIGGNALGDQSGPLARILAQVISLASPSFRSLQTAGIRSVIADRIDQMSEAEKSDYRMISRVVRYVISHKEAVDSSIGIQKLAKLASPTIQNDGLVAKQDMWIRGFGTILGELYLDHLEGVVGRRVPSVVENFQIERIRAFTTSLVLNLMKSRNTQNHEYRDLTRQRSCEAIFLSSR